MKKNSVLFPRRRVASAHRGQAQNIMKDFIPMIKSGSHVCISEAPDVSSYGWLSTTEQFQYLDGWSGVGVGGHSNQGTEWQRSTQGGGGGSHHKDAVLPVNGFPL